MSIATVPTAVLDEIVALQFLVGWAGEALSEPPRLGWWRTDVVDELGGGDFFRRLAPRTHRWAALEAARRAGMLADRKARSQMGDPDAVRTLFFWGFELDELLAERIRDLKRAEVADPNAALPFPPTAGPGQEFHRDRLEQELRQLAPGASFQAQPTGRQVRGSLPDDPAAAARALAACLVPFGEGYVPPFFRL